MQVIKSIIACILAILTITLLSIVMDHLLSQQISLIKQIARGGGIMVFILGVLLCVIYPMLAFPIGAFVGFILLGIAKYFQSRKTVFYTTLIYYSLLGIFYIGRLWYYTVPTMWEHLHLFWTGGALTCLFDLSIAIIIVFFAFFYLDSETEQKAEALA
jgi:hypothetical protein